MKKFISVVCLLALVGILGFVAFKGKDNNNVNNGNNNENNENNENNNISQLEPVYFGDYNLDEVVTLGEYLNLIVDVTYKPIKESEIIGYINTVLKQYPGYEKTDDTVVDDGDIVDLNYVGYWKGEVFDESKNVYLGIGSKKFIEGFESGLIGAKVGDTVTLKLTFPADYKDYLGNISELAGQETEFKVTINAIVKEVVYTYDNVPDDYCYINFNYKNKQEIYDYVDKMMKEELEAQKKSDARLAVLDGVVKRCTIEAPEELVTYQVEKYILALKADVEKAGYKFDEYLDKYYKKTYDEFYDEIYVYMEASVKEQFALLAVAKAENIVLDEKGYAEYVAAYVKYYGYKSEEEMYQDYPKEDMQIAFLCNDVLDYLIEKTTINYIEKTGDQK